MGLRIAGAARIGVGVGVLGALLTAMAAAAGGGADASTVTASLSIAPPSQTVDAGDTVKVEISVNNVANMVAWDFTLGYEEDVLEFVSAAADKTMLQPLGTPTCLSSIRREPPPPYGDGVSIIGLDVGCATAGVGYGAPGVGGSGKLATITFKAKAAGKSPLVFKRMDLSNSGSSAGYDIPVTGSTAMVCVDVCSGVEPTPTYNPALLTPTAVSGGSQYDPPDESDPNAPAGGYPTPTPRTGTSRPVTGDTNGGTPIAGGTTGGTLAGSTVRSGSGSAPGVSGATDGNGFPVAGTGAGAGQDALAWPAWIIIISGSAGLALLSAGALSSRRGSA